ncbi:MAG: VacJ family lipoprotein [Inquilinus sp.]|nr:VacJ family lipoprotein [Inquilinus sp.]
MFQVNDAADFLVVRPVSETYRQVVPDPLQEMVTNVLRNLRTPVIVLNQLLQGDWEGAEVAATRFFLNSTVGVLGLVDIAGYGNPELAYESEDFGQTLAVWGVGDGPYLVLPLLGPSNVRDTAGRVVDIGSDPLTYTLNDDAALARNILTVVDARTQLLDPLDEVRRSSLDYYAAVRSLYVQSRDGEIQEGAAAEGEEFPDFEDFDDFEDFEGFDDPPPPTDSGEAGPPSNALLSESPPLREPPPPLVLDLDPRRNQPR